MVRQMHLSSAKQFAVLLVVLLAMWGMGCNGCQPPATVDEPASNLDVNFAVLDITETPSDGKVIAVMQLLKNGTVVQFGSNASATCNGVALTYNALTTGYAERVPLLAVGGTYNFRYSR